MNHRSRRAEAHRQCKRRLVDLMALMATGDWALRQRLVAGKSLYGKLRSVLRVYPSQPAPAVANEERT
eukprot:1085357-Rhodomonas_salina.1